MIFGVARVRWVGPSALGSAGAAYLGLRPRLRWRRAFGAQCVCPSGLGLSWVVGLTPSLRQMVEGTSGIRLDPPTR